MHRAVRVGTSHDCGYTFSLGATTAEPLVIAQTLWRLWELSYPSGEVSIEHLYQVRIVRQTMAFYERTMGNRRDNGLLSCVLIDGTMAFCATVTSHPRKEKVLEELLLSCVRYTAYSASHPRKEKALEELLLSCMRYTSTWDRQWLFCCNRIFVASTLSTHSQAKRINC